MRPCLICGGGAVEPLLDFGPQALCNRFLARAEEPEALFGLALGQCDGCGLIQIVSPAPPKEVRPRFAWITYGEQEGHLDDLVQRVCAQPGVNEDSVVGAISFKDDSTVARFQKKGFGRTWRLEANADLGIQDAAAGLETVQEALSAAQAEQIAARRGPADVLIVRHILEHAHQTQRFAGALKRLVKPNGLFVFEVPDCRPALERRDYSMPMEEHIVYFTLETFRRSLATLGFSEAHYQSYTYANENSLTAIVKNREASGPGTAANQMLVGSPRRGDLGRLGEPSLPPMESAFSRPDLSPRTASAPDDLQAQKSLGRSYARSFPGYRTEVGRSLEECRRRCGKIAVFGAGHLSCFWINALGVAQWIEFVLDDHPAKRGLLMPGSRLPIRSSASLLEENVKLCLLSLSPESEAKVVAKNQLFLDRGGFFASIFPGKPNSLAAH